MGNNKYYLSIVVPVYNEEKRIDECLKKIHKYLDENNISAEVIISDDGSRDATKNIVKKHQESWESLKLLENTHKGKAPAIISGVLNSSGDYILFTDVDLSVDIYEANKLLKKIHDENFDLAIASREGEGAQRINEPLTRHIMGRVFNFLVQAVVLPGINDTQCGFKMFRKEVAHKIFRKTLLYSLNDKEITGGRVSAFDVELLYIAMKMGFKIAQVPVVWIYGDVSKVHNLKDSYYNAKDVFRVRLNSLLKKYNFS